MLKKFFAECFGTFVLVFVACGVAAITHGDVVPTALAFGLVIVAMAYSIGNVSGCHINPAVSVAMLIRKKMSVKEFFVYVLAQFVGALIGGILLFAIFKMIHYDYKEMYNTIKVVGNASNITPNGKQNAAGIIGAIAIEVILTFIFVFVILNVTDKKFKNPALAGLIIGATLTLVHLVGIGFTGTSVNPARSLGSAVGSAIFGWSTKPLEQIWIFIVAPLAGGALAALAYPFLSNKDEECDTAKADAKDADDKE